MVRPKTENPRDTIVPVRMTSAEKALLESAAQEDGAGLSTWLRTLGLARAKIRRREREPRHPPPARRK